MSIRSLEDVLLHSMKDLLSAEKQFSQALKKLSAASSDAELATAFNDHHTETVRQIERLKKGFEILHKSARSQKCEAAEGLTKEGQEVIEQKGEAPAKDIMLAGAGRKTEHYEIASYESAASIAKKLGYSDLANLLNETLREELAADKRLEGISQRLSRSA